MRFRTFGDQKLQWEETYNGYRTAKELLLGKVQELKRSDLLQAILSSAAVPKVFCSALVKDESVKTKTSRP